MKAILFLLASAALGGSTLAEAPRLLSPAAATSKPPPVVVHSPALSEDGATLWFLAEGTGPAPGPGLHRLDTASLTWRLALPGRVLSYAVAGSGAAVAVELAGDRPDLGDTNGLPDLFHLTTATGELKLASRTMARPAPGRAGAGNPQISHDGDLILFESHSGDLARFDSNHDTDIFLYSRKSDSLSLVSSTSTAWDATEPRGASEPLFALGERAVLYFSPPAQEPANSSANSSWFLRGLDGFRPLSVVSIGSDQRSLWQCCEAPAISANGRFATVRSGWRERKIHLVDLREGILLDLPGPHAALPGLPPSEVSNDGARLALLRPKPRGTGVVLEVFDRPSGRGIVAVPNGQGPAPGFVPSWIWLSPDGRHLLFTASMGQVGRGEPDKAPLHLFHREIDAPTLPLGEFLEAGRVSRPWPGLPETAGVRSVSVAPGAGGSAPFTVAWEAALDPAEGVGGADVFWTSLPATNAPRSLRATIQAGLPSTTAPGHSLLGAKPLDAAGAWLAIESSAHLAGGVPSPFRQIYLRPIGKPGATLASAAPDGTPGDGPSFAPVLSANGNAVVFQSWASNLAPGDSNTNTADLFLHDRIAGTIELVNTGLPHTPAPGQGRNPSRVSLSADASKILFLAQTAPDKRPAHFLRDRASGATRLLSHASLPDSSPIPLVPPQISPDGQWVLFHTFEAALPPLGHRGLRLWHTTRDEYRALPDPAGGTLGLIPAKEAFDAAGSKVLLTTATPSATGTVHLYDIPSGTLRPVATNWLSASISADGHFALVVSASTPGAPRLELVSLEDGVRSHFSIGDPGSVEWDRLGPPSLSANGDWIAFASGVNHAESGDTNNALDIFIGHRPTGALRRLASFQGLAASHPVLSADGRFVVFHAMGDFGEDRNGSIDIFMAPVAGEAVDSDGDGMDDAWEIAHFDTLAANPGEDPDGDGMTNLQEFLAGTNPRDGSSLLALQAFKSLTTGAVHLVWPSAQGVRYQVEARETLEGSPWTALGAAASHPGATATLIDANPPATTRFYRVRVAR